MTLPVVHLTGNPYDQGLKHGQVLRDRIHHNLAVYFHRFALEGVGRATALTRAAQYVEVVEQLDPDYCAGMRGIAEGSGRTLAEIAALNVRYEILYYQFGVNGVVDGCTSVAVLPHASANGHLLLAQNWDWIPEVQGAILDVTEPLSLEHGDRLRVLAFTEAGIFGGKIGLNSAGIGLAINGLCSTADDWSRLTLPFHVRCHRILRSRTLDQARAIVADSERAYSANFLVVQAPDQVVDLEAAPDAVASLACADGCLVHTNHFVAAADLGIVEPMTEPRPHSRPRLARMQALLAAEHPLSVADLQSHLRDHEGHPYGICRHVDYDEPPKERFSTVVSAIMDLETRELLVADGLPCEAPFERFELQALTTA